MNTGLQQISARTRVNQVFHLLLGISILALAGVFASQKGWIAGAIESFPAIWIYWIWRNIYRFAAEFFIDDERRVIEARRDGICVVVHTAQ